MKYIAYPLFLAFFLLGCKTEQNESTTIAFGSCSRQNNQPQLWSEINQINPDIFIFLGDNIYGESNNFSSLKQGYEIQKSNPELVKLFNNQPVIGTWDDHDYGVNDGGKHFAHKDSSKLLFMEFMGIEEGDPINSHNGVYNSYTLNQGKHAVKFIMLDTRYFRDTLYKDSISGQRYLANKEGTILGDEQWDWLTKELNQNEADLTIIGSSIQVLSPNHPYEKWSNFPKDHQRLLSLLRDKPNVILISGDRHIAELSKFSFDNGNDLYDLTASGLTHTWEDIGEEYNENRVGKLLASKNYGVIDVDWSQRIITFKVLGQKNQNLLTHTISF